MAFGTGMRLPYRGDEGAERGLLREAAVKCWFTAGGRAIPLSMKIREADGTIRTVDEIGVLHSEKKFYAGIPVWEYHCAADLGAGARNCVLRFYPERCMWRILGEGEQEIIP